MAPAKSKNVQLATAKEDPLRRRTTFSSSISDNKGSTSPGADDDDEEDGDDDSFDAGPLHEPPLPALPPTPLLDRTGPAHAPEDNRHKRLRFDAFARVPPVYIVPHRPDHHEVKRADGKTPAWLPEHLLSTSWLTLFYDLVMVAALHTFSDYHEVVSASGVGIFWSYFLLIWWLWVDQCVYDIRFSAEDLYHRFCKLLQIFVFMYIGAASGGWSPTSLKQEIDDFSYEATKRTEAASSFLLVTIAYAASRAIMAAQYLVLLIVARRIGRPLPSLCMPLLGTLLSMGLCIAAATLGDESIGPSIVKPLLVYLGLAIEIVAVIWTPFLKSYIPIPAHILSERIGALTLIILGEGLLSLVSAFNTVINGFTRGDSKTYLEVFCAVFTVYLIWMFYFTGFDTRHWMGRRRIWAWTVLHAVLHFTTILFTQGMVNVVKFSAFADGADWINDKLIGVIESTNGTIGPPVGALNTTDGRKLAIQLGKLDLDPPWQDELARLQNAILDPFNPNFPAGELFQYIGQIFYETAGIYRVEIHHEMESIARSLATLNVSLSGNASFDNEIARIAGSLYVELLISGYNSAIEGCLWLFPTAGGVMLLIGIANIIRYHFKGLPIPWYDISQIVVGVILALLGLMAIGPQSIVYSQSFGEDAEINVDAALKDQNTVYKLVFNHWLLQIVLLVYLAFWIGSSVWLLMKRKTMGEHLVEWDDALPSVRTRIKRAKREQEQREKTAQPEIKKASA